MTQAPLISDAELLSLGIASDSLGRIPQGERDTARLAACSFVLSFFKKRFALPLIAWSDDVKRAAAHVAAYDLLVRRGFNAIAGSDETIEKRYLNACDWLTKVAKGLVEPESITDSSPTVEEAAPLVSSEPSRWPTYGNRRGWRRC